VVTKKKQSGSDKRGKKKPSKLKLNKETVKDLTDTEAGKIKGGAMDSYGHGGTCAYSCGPTCKNTCENCSIGCISAGSVACCDTNWARCPKNIG